MSQEGVAPWSVSEALKSAFAPQETEKADLPDLLNRNRPVCRTCGGELQRQERYYEAPFAAHADFCPEHGA